MNRQPIQIVVHDDALVVLCSDGTLWQRTGDGWNAMEGVPQPEAADPLLMAQQRMLGTQPVPTWPFQPNQNTAGQPITEVNMWHYTTDSLREPYGPHSAQQEIGAKGFPGKGE